MSVRLHSKHIHLAMHCKAQTSSWTKKNLLNSFKKKNVCDSGYTLRPILPKTYKKHNKNFLMQHIQGKKTPKTPYLILIWPLPSPCSPLHHLQDSCSLEILRFKHSPPSTGFKLVQTGNVNTCVIICHLAMRPSLKAGCN